MNERSRHIRAPQRLADTIRRVGARVLVALAMLPFAVACAIPEATQQDVAKAVIGSKSINAITATAPTAIPTPTAVPTAPPAPSAKPAPTSTPAAAGQPVSVGTNGGEWQFDMQALEAAAGAKIVLTFRNNAKHTAHNWLLIEGGDDAASAVNAAGEQAGQAAGYIPDDKRIVARTAGLVAGGQSATVTFGGLKPGTYIYLCTFPGHFELGMKGVLTVR